MSASAPAESRRRARVRVEGTVQGVGFRPFAYRLAAELHLAGFVLNDTHGVLLEIEGRAGAVAEFMARLEREAPPLAVLERVRAEERPLAGGDTFTIAPSPQGGTPDAPVTPDSATCPDCLRELFDPDDRRFRYPFVNCTNCGPRFTIVQAVPYDRPLTTMARFEMCPACQAEYDDPGDRRFHAQPNACPVCGPSVRVLTPDGSPGGDGDAIRTAAASLRGGAIVAVKGIGGYHLACLAGDEAAVARLRARKHREDKPFAVMTSSLAAAGTLVALGELERALLEGPARPIVLAPRRADAPIASAVAPGAPELGVLHPYSPLHHLLLADVGAALVMTSGNVSDEPIAFTDEEALERLAGIADLFLVHDRPIETRTDDSVVRAVTVAGRRQPAFLRRSRGYVPATLALPGPGTPRPLLACGAELKSTFCLARGDRAWVSHHIGDLENYETLRSFADGIEHFGRLFAVAPRVIAHDLHPEYLSTKYALNRDDVAHIAVQHHHAHLAACLAEHRETEAGRPAVGAIFDGTGYGTDGTVWGGELLVGDAVSFDRAGMLAPVVMPGGERAIRQPWRMACAWLSAASGHPPALPDTLAASVAPSAWGNVCELVRTGIASPTTTSMGRLFDAAAAIAGVRAVVNYEGQAAVEFEAVCEPGEHAAYEISLTPGDAGLVIDPRPTIAMVAADARSGVSPGVIAARFHNTVAAATIDACVRLAGSHDTERVVLSGGVFQNRRLLESVSTGLGVRGLRVLVPERLPVNDGGIAYGQAAVAAARLRGGIDLEPSP
ncbi:MAG: carbamoyltransferase HypF [Solirubrobacteraceae bacterium]